jgi:ATP-dependent protease HslVU (ClpYQ) ATPase subunit
LLAAPRIIEALYKNKNARMSTADRLVELAARNNVNLDGVATFRAHVEALRGMLIPAEPLAEPLPEDETFATAIAVDADDKDAVMVDPVEGTETLKEQFKPLSMQIREMNTAQKLRLTLVGNAAARAILVRDSNKVVQHAAIASPTMTEAEAVGIAFSKEVSEDVLRFIGNNRRDWLRNYELKRALIFNPKTPVGISLSLLAHLRDSDLKTLARSRNVGSAIKAAAAQRIAKKENKKG